MLGPEHHGVLVLSGQSRVRNATGRRALHANQEKKKKVTDGPTLATTSSMMHVGRGREHPLHIEYVHIGACLAFIQDTLTEALLSHPRLPMARKIAFVKALGKVIWIQNDLFAKWYVRDGDEFADEMEQHTRLYEREGYLNGRKVLDGVDEDGGGEDGGSEGEGEAASLKMPTPPAACPFSGVPIRHKAQTPTGEKGAPPSPPTSVSVPEISVAEV